jgi:transposase
MTMAIKPLLRTGRPEVPVCPWCGTVFRRIHSRYRRVSDLRLSGRMVQLLVIARRFSCDAVLCGRQSFTDRFAEGMLLHRHGAQGGWSASCTILVWRLADARLQPSQNG